MSVKRSKAARSALAMVGCSVFHRGEHGLIVNAMIDTYAEPMLRVQFCDGRVATLKPSEVGAA